MFYYLNLYFNFMILILPLLFAFILFLIKDNDEIISKYGILSIIIYYLNISSYGNSFIFHLIIIIIVLYWIYDENGLIGSNLFYSLSFALSSIFIFYANSLYAFFISVELITLIILTFINLYIQDKYPGILYYLFSGLFSALFIFSLGYLYMGYTIAYSFLSLVFIWKLGLGPLHILMPYIYNSLSPKKILFIDIICKYLLFYIFSRLIISIPINLNFIICITVILGALLALNENNLLNILVYSSISNNGLLLILINDISLFFIYLVFYSFMVIIYLYLISHLCIFYSFNNNYYIILWFILISNLIGIPPLTGFWIKLYVLYILVLNNSYIILFIILLSLVLLSSVYIRILLGYIVNENTINVSISNNNIFQSHFIASLAILLISFN